MSPLIAMLKNSQKKVKNKPLYHFTPNKGWINDPNGLVYDEYNKVYHLFAQYSYHIDNNGIDGWIHATSKDLLSWEEKGLDIVSNKKGAAWSGGAVVDYNNTSGLFNDDVPGGSRMVCFVTYQTANPKLGIVYSLDQGKTWIEYKDFIIENKDNEYTNEFRDPKVFWYVDKNTNKGKWILVAGGFTKIRLFSSDNLLNWKYESDALDYLSNPVESECPDIFKIKSEEGYKYVLSTGGTSYIVGDIFSKDGTIVFKGEQKAKKMFFGPKIWTHCGEMYATQSFFNDEKGRTIIFSWAIDRSASRVNDKPWNGAESLPMEGKLIKENNEYNLYLYPIEELNNYRHKIKEKSSVNFDTFDYEFSIDISNVSGIKITFSNKAYPYLEIDKEKGIFKFESKDDINGEYIVEEKIDINKEKLDIRIIEDSPILEIYINKGLYNFHCLYFANENTELEIEATDGKKLSYKEDYYNL